MNSNEDIELFSQEVLNYMVENSIPSSPHNYEFYFSELLKNKDSKTQKYLNEFIDYTDPLRNQQNIIELNHSIKSGYVNIRKLFQLIKNININSQKINQLLKKSSQKYNNLSGTLSKFSLLLETHILEIKKIEKNTKLLLINLEKNNIYDNNFNVFNKKHILELIEKEIKVMEKHEYPSSMLFVKINKIEFETDDRKILILNKFLSNLLTKNARNSDFIGYLGDNIFVLLLTQTDLKSAKLTKKRIHNLILSSCLFIDGDELILDINIVVKFLSSNTDMEEVLIILDEELNLS